MTERWKRDLERLTGVGPPEGLWAGIEDRSATVPPLGAGHGGLVRGVAAAVALAVFAGAIYVAARAFGGTGAPGPGGPAGPVEPGVSNVARIRCDGLLTRTTTPVVALQRNGLHLDLDGRGDARWVWLFQVAHPKQPVFVSLDGTFSAGDGTVLPPGRLLVECVTRPRPVGSRPGPGAVAITLVPGPEWTDPDLCRQPLPGLAPHPGGPLRGTPAGRLLLTVTSAGGVDFDLMWRQAGGGPAHPLVRTSQREWQGDWTPDGARLAFVRDGDIWDANGDGRGARRLTTDPLPAGPTDDEPRWSPDGTRVLFRSNRGKTLGLWTVNADGSGLSPLVRMEAESGSWSPDGRRIAFEGWRGSDPCKDAEIYVANADGSGLRQLTDDHYSELAPAWSPDGRTLAFMRSSGSDASWDLYLIDVASGHETRLTDAPGMDGSPVWSPDGRFIAFVSDRADPAGTRRGRRQRAFVMNLDGTGVSPLADLGPGGTQVDDWIA